MSFSYDKLHSHSGIEREVKMHNSHVLVDKKYEEFVSGNGQNAYPYFTHNNVTYIKIPTRLFVKLGGVFKNFSS